MKSFFLIWGRPFDFFFAIKYLKIANQVNLYIIKIIYETFQFDNSTKIFLYTCIACV